MKPFDERDIALAAIICRQRNIVKRGNHDV